MLNLDPTGKDRLREPALISSAHRLRILRYTPCGTARKKPPHAPWLRLPERWAKHPLSKLDCPPYRAPTARWLSPGPSGPPEHRQPPAEARPGSLRAPADVRGLQSSGCRSAPPPRPCCFP